MLYRDSTMMVNDMSTCFQRRSTYAIKVIGTYQQAKTQSFAYSMTRLLSQSLFLTCQLKLSSSVSPLKCQIWTSTATSYCPGQAVCTTLTIFTYNQSNFTILKQQLRIIISRMRDMPGLILKGSNKQQRELRVIYLRIKKTFKNTSEMEVSYS